MNDLKKGNSKLFYIYKDGAYYPVGCLTSNSFSESAEMLGTTTRQNAGGWKTSKPTNQSYSISLGGLATTSDKDGSIITYKDLQDYKRSRTLLNWKTNSELTGYSDFGMCYITDLDNNAEVGSFIDFTASIEGYGEPVTQLDTQENLNYTLNVTI